MGRIANKIIPSDEKSYPKNSKYSQAWYPKCRTHLKRVLAWKELQIHEKITFFSEDEGQTSENDEWVSVSCCGKAINWKVNFPRTTLVHWENRMDTEGWWLLFNKFSRKIFLFSVDMHNILSCGFHNCILFHYWCGKAFC